jgi:hypothetical protein
VLHFPIRAAHQATAKYLVWAEVLGDASHLAAVRATGAGRNGATGPGYFLDESSVERGLAAGVLVEDVRLRDVLRTLMVPGPEPTSGVFPRAEREGRDRDRASDFDADALRLRRRSDELARRTLALETR